MKINRIELKQNKVVQFVKNYFIKKNSPFLKKNHFALYENGDGFQKIQKVICSVNKKKNVKYHISSILNLISIFKYNNLSFPKKNFSYKNLIITWGDNFSLSQNGIFKDKYFSLKSNIYRNTFWIVLSGNKIYNKRLDSNIAIIYPKKKLLNFFYFLKYICFCIFNQKKFFIDQDQIIADHINDYISKNTSLAKIENLIMPYEGQAFQKIIFFKQKKINRKLKTYGFDHSAPHSLPTQIYYTAGSPDKLLVSGSNTKKCYSRFYNWPKKKIILTFPSRYKNHSKKNFSNNLFLPYDFINGDIILNSLDSYLKLVPDNSLNLINIKIHPVKLADKKHVFLKHKLESLIAKYHLKFSSQHKKPIVIVVGFTTAAIVALEFNMPVLHICPNLNLDPYLNFFWRDIKIVQISNNCFLYKLIKNYKYLNFRSDDKIKKILK